MSQEKKRFNFRDSLDNKFDVSDFLLNPYGFFPYAQPITEPALGHIGLIGGPIFIKPNKNPMPGRYTPPTITAIIGGYSANGTWMTAFMHSGYSTRHKLKYRITTGFTSLNLDFYRSFPMIGEQSFSFNFKSIPVIGSVLRQLGNSRFYAGLEYIYLSSDVTPETNSELINNFVNEKDLDSQVSSPGLVTEYEGRDNIFTPDSGTFVNASFHLNRNWTGSDYAYQNFTLTVLQYFRFHQKWISGVRFLSELQGGDAPFYLKPAINMRGVPSARYQGESVFILETEQRYDFSLRWSGVIIGGLAKAIPESTSFNDATLVYNYGGGFRYLIARKFKLRVGIDVAWSNDDFGYYIIFGSAWNQ